MLDTNRSLRFEDLSDDLARMVDEVCCEYERDSQNGRLLQVEYYLDRLPREVIPVALNELQNLQRVTHKKTAEIQSLNTTMSVENEALPNTFHGTNTRSGAERNHVDADGMVQQIMGSSFHSEYEQLTEIGRGGMGIVFRAYDSQLQRYVALKFLIPEALTSKHRVARFQREARLISLLNHPNICTIHALKRWKEYPYMVLEWIEGHPLRHHIRPRNIAAVPNWFAQIAMALACAHGQRIVHRDMKPENILIRKDGIVKLLDFGLSRLIGGSQLSRSSLDSTHHGILGTLPYMSPEQIAGCQATCESDLFSLGVMLYESLTGVHPFAGLSQIETLEAIEHCNPLPPHEINPLMDGRLAELTARLLQKDPKHRPTAEIVYERLMTVAGEPCNRNPFWPERLVEPIRSDSSSFESFAQP